MLERRNPSRQTVDRRNKNRIYAEFDISTLINEQEIKTRVRNMSCSGIQLVEPDASEIAIYQDCQIFITDQNTDEKIELNARVIWKRFGLMGLSFQNMDKEAKQSLDHLLNMKFMESVSVNGMSALA